MGITSKVVAFGSNGAQQTIYTEEDDWVHFLASHILAEKERFGVFRALGSRNFGPNRTDETNTVAWGRFRINGVELGPGEKITILAGEDIIMEPLELPSAYHCTWL